MIKLFIFCFFTFITTSIFSAETDFRFNHLDVNDEVSKQTFKSYQDSNGYLWFGTDLGTYRYDGYETKHYVFNPNESNHIVNNYVDDIIEFENEIWIGTEGGISVIGTDSNRHYINSEDGISLLDDWITSFFIYKSELYITTTGGVSKYNRANNNFQEIIKSTNDVFSSKVINNTIYLGLSNGLYLLDVESNEINLVSPSITYTVDVIYPFENGLYIGTESNGLWFYDLISNETINIYSGRIQNNLEPSITDITEYNGEILFSTFNEGFYSLNPKTNKIISQFTENRYVKRTIKSKHVYSLIVDKTGVLWVSTHYGVSYYSPLKNGTRLKYGIDGISVNNSIILNNKNYMATSKGIRIYDNEKNKFISNLQFKKLDNIKVWDIQINKSNNLLWFATESGIAQYSLKTKLLTTYNNKKFLGIDREIYTITIINDNLVYFSGQRDAGVKLFNTNTNTIVSDLIQKGSHYLKDYSFASEIKIVKNNLWLASVTGLYRFNLITNEETHFNITPSIKNIRIQDLTSNEQGYIWIATNGSGIYGFDSNVENPKFHKIDTGGINVFDNIINIKNKLWYTSRKNIYSYDFSSKETKSFINLLTDSDISFNLSSMRYNHNNDTLNIGTSDGLFTVKIDDLKSNQIMPNILINEFKINNEITTLNKVDHILEYNSRVDFKFSSLDFNFIKNNRFKYKLDGVDKKWNFSKDNNVTYTSLKQGNYVFHVKGSNSDEIWSEKSAKINFYVGYAWWYYLFVFLAVLFLLIITTVFIIRQNQIKKLNKQANTDNLTGLYNRLYFYEYTKNLIKNKASSFAVIYLDLDNFKEINDTMGHSVGDQLIIEFSNRLTKFFDEKNVVVRLSGDEFAVVVDYKLRTELTANLNNIKNNINSKYNLNDKIVNCTSSVGVAFYPDDSNDFENLLINADIAMYASKKKGKNKLSYFTEDMKNEFNEKAEIRKLLSHALQNDEFSINYQPKFCMNRHLVTGFEALIRWNHQKKGYISPAIFIPEAENNGLIIEIGEWVLREACIQASKWNNDGLLISNVSVNISAVQLHDENIINIIIAALNNSNLPANKLELEITETVFVSDINKTIKTLKQIRELGVRIALDDFGTGYSSLSYLKSFPINTLKIDRSFIQDLREGNTNEIILKNIFNLANDLKFEVVVEGVEHKSELEIIQKYNCDYIQGFYFSPPVTIENATRILTNGLNKNIIKIA
jgi:diguanylate cyclase (GGDEF)-like protein